MAHMDLENLKERVMAEVARLLAEDARAAGAADGAPAPSAPAATGAAGPGAAAGPAAGVPVAAARDAGAALAGAPAAAPRGAGGAQVGTQASAPAPGGAGPAEGAAHLARLQAACLANPSAAVPAQVDVLVVLTGRDTLGDGLAAVRELVQRGYSAALVTSQALLEATGPGLLYEVLKGGPAFCHGDEELAARLVRAARVVVVPALSVSAAAQAAQLLAGDLAAAVVVQAILQRRPVVAARELVALPGAGPAWVPGAPAGGTPVPFALRRKLEEVVAALRGYGVALVDAAQLAQAAEAILGAPAVPAGVGAPSLGGGAVPAARGVPAPGGTAEAGGQPGATRNPGATALLGALTVAPPASGPGAAAPGGVASGGTVPGSPAPGHAAPGAAGPGASPGGWDRGLARIIDHTLLKPDATAAQIEQLCREALQYGFAAVCVNPTWVPLAARLLQGSDVKVCTVVGFPLGATSTAAKVAEARAAIAAGAREIDMVINIGALKSGLYDQVRDDIRAVVEAAHPTATVKVILETALLTDAEKVQACRLAREAGADFVKTSTGFGPGGATVHDVALLRREVGPAMGVKASGGIRDRATALAMVQAGANRIGASASVAIVTGGAGGAPARSA